MEKLQKDPNKIFGRYLKKLRERFSVKDTNPSSPNQDSSLTQKEASEILINIAKKNSTRFKDSSLSRFEDGITYIKPEIVKLISEAYNEPLERMISAYIAAFFFNAEPAYFLSKKSRRPYSGEIEEFFFISNCVETWTLTEILKWEEALWKEEADDDKKELWIISSEFYDHDNPKIQAVVENLIINSFRIKYFIPEMYRQHFSLFIKELKLRVEQNINDHNLLMYGLSPEEELFLTSSMVIAFPKHLEDAEEKASGFRIAKIRETPSFGIPMTTQEMRRVYARLRRLVTTNRITEEEFNHEK